MVNEFGADAGCILAAEKLEKCFKPGFMSENIRLSVLAVTEMREGLPGYYFRAPDGELPEGFEFVKPEGQEVLLWKHRLASTISGLQLGAGLISCQH